MSQEYSDLENGEQTPAPRTNVRKVTFRNPNNLKKKVNDKNNEKCWMCMMISFIIICLSILGTIIYYITGYYNDTWLSRKEKDNTITIVSEKYIDYTTNTQINCTNMNPCNDWNCKYVLEHFHKTPNECEYDDNLTLVTTLLIIFGILIFCNMCFSKQ